MHYQFVAIILLLLCRLLMADPCLKLLHRLAESQRLFVQCSTTSSVPVTLCVNCKNFYANMESSYRLLSEDPICSEKYFDKDRINVISSMQSLLCGLWSKAFCDDCFTNDNVFAFANKSIELNDCFVHNNGSECVACMVEYQDINNFYNNLDTHNNGRVCYDMQDEMNRTRFKWSNDFKCCKRQFNMTLFLFASTCAAVLPIVFYLSIFLYGKRREQNHGVIDADAEQSAALVEEDTACSQDNHTTVAAASLDPQVTPQNKKLDFETDSDESDYESAPKMH